MKELYTRKGQMGRNRRFYAEFRVSMDGKLTSKSAKIKGSVIANEMIVNKISAKSDIDNKYSKGVTASINIGGTRHDFVCGIYVGTGVEGNPNPPFEI